jgi:hypothetical protein
VRVILGQSLRDLPLPAPITDRVCVKGVVFPFRTFPTLAPVLGPEMQSTGESMGVGRTFAAAYWKSWFGAGLQRLPHGRPVYFSPGDVVSQKGVGFLGRDDVGGCPLGRMVPLRLASSSPATCDVPNRTFALARAAVPAASVPPHKNANWPATVVDTLQDAGCTVLMPPASLRLPSAIPCPPEDIDITTLGLVIALGRSEGELSLLRRAVDARIPTITTLGGLRALLLALHEGEPCLDIASGW